MGAQARSIEVTAARVRMGDLLRDVPEPWASLDMGAAPEPMQEARYTKDDIEARAYKARLPLPQDIEVPRVLRVVRTGQVVTEPHLANLVRQSLIAALPPGTRIRSLRLNGGVVLPQGPVYIRPELPEVLEHGEQLLRIGVGVRSDAQGSHTVVEACVDMQLQSRRKGVPVLGRGSEVTVQIVTKGVLVQASGLAQEPGSIGDYIKVLPIQGNRMLQARIIDARTVEVRL
jgi:hypothetical protein